MADYIDKAEMLKEIADYRELCRQAREELKEKPPVSNSLMTKFFMMTNGIGRRPNFSGYSYLDEMKSRALYACFKKANYFDPEKSANPFGYYSRVIWREFINVIKEEEKQSYIKAKAFYNHEASFSAMEQDDDVDLTVEGFSVPYFDVDDYERRNDIVQKKGHKKAKHVVGPLSALEEDEDVACSEFDSLEKFEVSDESEE